MEAMTGDSRLTPAQGVKIMTHSFQRSLPWTVLIALVAFPRLSLSVETVCHRGANEYAPENTRAATQLCIGWGMDYVEIDVRTSKDGVMVLMHDSKVARTTDGGDDYVYELTSEQIDRLDAGSWFDPKFAGEKVPRLEPYLRWLKGKIKVYLDVKHADLEQLIALVHELEMEEDCFFWFGNKRQALAFRELDKTLALKINAGTPEQVREAIETYNPQIIETGLGSCTPELIEACRKNGLKLMVLHGEKDESAFREIIRLGADMVNLNHGDVFRKVEKEMAEGAVK